MSDLARRIEALPPEKRALLEKQLLQRRAAAASVPAIPRRAPGPCPLSFPQQRLWFLDQWRPGSHVYNAALPMRLRGLLDTNALEAALATVVERHEALRTVFRVGPGGPVQVVLDDRRFELETVDLRNVPRAGREAEALAVLQYRARRPFNLADDLMLRATLVRIGDEEHLFQLEEHHIAFDGWSDGILFRELAELYRASQEGRHADLPELPIQYGDFAAWQRTGLAGERLEQLVSYWRAQLAGVPALLRLPADRPRPAVQSFEGEHLPVELPQGVGDAVRSLAREESMTPFMLLYAAFAALLYRISGADDIVVGTPIANRDQLELEHLIGFFSNTLALRLRLAGNPTFRELMRRAREAALGAFAHQDLPFERVVEAVRPERDAGVNPLFQVNFRVQTGASSTLELDGIEVEPLTIDVGFARFDLALELQLTERGIGGYLEYNLGLFERSTAEAVAVAFVRLVEQLLASPDLTLLELDVPRLGPAADSAPRLGDRIPRRRTLDPLPAAD